MKQYKKIQALGDWIAVVPAPMQAGEIIVDEATAAKYSTEGIVIGAGPDAKVVSVGDKVIFRPSKYMEIEPEGGSYAGSKILMMRPFDVLIKKNIVDGEFEVVD